MNMVRVEISFMNKELQVKKRKSYAATESELTIIVLRPDFQERLNAYKNKLALFNLSIPEIGLKNKSALDAWIQRYNSKSDQLATSTQFTSFVASVCKSPEKMTFRQYVKIECYRADHFLPEDWFQILADAMLAVGLNPDDEKQRGFLTNYFFFGRTSIQKPDFARLMRKNPETSQLELFVEIFPYTTQAFFKKYSGSWLDDKRFVTKNSLFSPIKGRGISFLVKEKKDGPHLFLKVENYTTTRFILSHWKDIEQKKLEVFGSKTIEKRSKELEKVARLLSNFHDGCSRGADDRARSPLEIIRHGSSLSGVKSPAIKKVRARHLMKKLAMTKGVTAQVVRKAMYRVKKIQKINKKS